MRISISAKAMMIYGIVFLFIIALTFWLSYAGIVGRLQKDLQDAPRYHEEAVWPDAYGRSRQMPYGDEGDSKLVR
jgi:hypothetical protein